MAQKPVLITSYKLRFTLKTTAKKHFHVHMHEEIIISK